MTELRLCRKCHAPYALSYSPKEQSEYCEDCQILVKKPRQAQPKRKPKRKPNKWAGLHGRDISRKPSGGGVYKPD